jgi:alkylation response protein AidB-like acyl-CoA dehydrogenase
VVYPLPSRPSADSGPGTDVEGLVFTRAEFDVALVPVDTGSGIAVHTVRFEDVVLTPVDGMDETLGLSRLTARRDDLVPAAGASWAAGLAAGRRALAHELVGLSSQMLKIVVEHVSTREQFGRPLGANQVIQHRLADVKVDLTAAEMICDESWHTDTPLAAAAAKAQAGNAFNLTATHGQQFLGGIGYTWEHHWRHHVRRGFVLSVLLGASDECEAEIAATLLDEGVLRIGNLL